MKLIIKKIIMYTLAIVGQVIITLIISSITGVEPTNTWLGLLFGNAFVLTIIYAHYDIAKSVKDTHSLLGCVLHISMAIAIFVLILVNIAFLFGAFNG